MIRAETERNRQPAVVFWSYVLTCLDKLKHDGMSDEEDGVLNEGHENEEQVKFVLVADFRHPSLRQLFEIVDKTPGLEELIFKQTGRTRRKRVRIDKVSKRPPPKRLPTAFFRDGYLDSLMPHQREDLVLSRKEFALHTFAGYDPLNNDGDNLDSDDEMEG
ncbi:hypothetical protein FB446DRAFT_654368 [Lentinula raphanica]|nr:hypothetical protein FB446DRAFT_654368 [Lentinula raphanica]